MQQHTRQAKCVRLTVSVCVAILALHLWLPSSRAAEGASPTPTEASKPRIIISTDVSIGLIDTHGGKSLTPVSFDADYAYMRDTNVAPQDIDDGLALAMALNLDASGLIELLAVVPTYGNATLPAEMLVARQLARKLKGRNDIPIVPGAVGPAAQILNPTATWFDDTNVKITGKKGSFEQACGNQGVDLMREMLLSAGGFGTGGPVTILAIGPMTDVACLLQTAPKRAIRNIKEIVILASRIEGQSVEVNGKIVNDFNFRMDPVGGTLLLAAGGAAANVPIRLMSFSLSGQTSQAATVFGFDADTYPGPSNPTSANKKSFKWLLKAAGPRNDYWSGIFGTLEGPFDQYTLSAAMHPEFFDCEAGLAYVQMCPYPAWSPDYPTDGDANPTEDPYNAPDNPCTDHGTANGSSPSEVPAELIATTDLNESGRLVRGKTGIDGNIPSLKKVSARPVTVCLDFAGKKGRTRFEDFLKDWTW